MFLQYARTAGVSVAQIVLLGAVGYFLMKKEYFGKSCLDSLSRLTLDITLPIMIFCSLIKNFSFQQYPHWWYFPLASVGVTVFGFAVGALFLKAIKGRQEKLQFLSLVGFQNAGFLPLMLFATLLPAQLAGSMFIYLFLFLIGFNVVMFSLGVVMLASGQGRAFEWKSLFSPPVAVTVLSLLLVYFGLNIYVPQSVITPLKMLGDCTVPLSMLVVGGNLAQIHLPSINKKAMALMALAKLVILPAVGLWVMVYFKLPALVALLLLVELAVPPATTSSVIVRQYQKEDLLVSEGIFVGHILSLVTLPIYLSLYFTFFVLK